MAPNSISLTFQWTPSAWTPTAFSVGGRRKRFLHACRRGAGYVIRLHPSWGDLAATTSDAQIGLIEASYLDYLVAVAQCFPLQHSGGHMSMENVAKLKLFTSALVPNASRFSAGLTEGWNPWMCAEFSGNKKKTSELRSLALLGKRITSEKYHQQYLSQCLFRGKMLTVVIVNFSSKFHCCCLPFFLCLVFTPKLYKICYITYYIPACEF